MMSCLAVMGRMVALCCDTRAESDVYECLVQLCFVSVVLYTLFQSVFMSGIILMSLFGQAATAVINSFTAGPVKSARAPECQKLKLVD